MRYVTFGLLLALAAMAWNLVLRRLGRQFVGHAYGIPALLFVTGALGAVVFAAIPVGLAGTPNWTYGLALSLTLGLLVFRVIRFGTAASSRGEVAEHALHGRGLVLLALIGAALGILLIIGGVAQIHSGRTGGGLATLMLGVLVIAGGGAGLFLLGRLGSAK